VTGLAVMGHSLARTHALVHEHEHEGVTSTEFAARRGVDPLVIPGTHMTMPARPDTVAQALLSA
jgi:hypothetical protein